MTNEIPLAPNSSPEVKPKVGMPSKIGSTLDEELRKFAVVQAVQAKTVAVDNSENAGKNLVATADLIYKFVKGEV